MKYTQFEFPALGPERPLIGRLLVYFPRDVTGQNKEMSEKAELRLLQKKS